MKCLAYKINGFTGTGLEGSPAVVCQLEEWWPDEVLQEIAFQAQVPETAFFISQPEHYQLRWFTPKVEVDLCGHATLAAAYMIFQDDPSLPEIIFDTRSGRLGARHDGSRIMLDFPVDSIRRIEIPDDLIRGLRARPEEVWISRDYMAVFDSERQVAALHIDNEVLSSLERQGVIATAPGSRCDFVSRYFAPAEGLPEDPVTGSAHCSLVPYWATRLGRKQLHAIQISPRGGEIWCELRGNRVELTGNVVPCSQFWVEVPEDFSTTSKSRSEGVSRSKPIVCSS
jgi:predicted PhzF superfamily epimerase YddE/YHI9